MKDYNGCSGNVVERIVACAIPCKGKFLSGTPSLSFCSIIFRASADLHSILLCAAANSSKLFLCLFIFKRPSLFIDCTHDIFITSHKHLPQFNVECMYCIYVRVYVFVFVFPYALPFLDLLQLPHHCTRGKGTTTIRSIAASNPQTPQLSFAIRETIPPSAAFHYLLLPLLNSTRKVPALGVTCSCWGLTLKECHNSHSTGICVCLCSPYPYSRPPSSSHRSHLSAALCNTGV